MTILTSDKLIMNRIRSKNQNQCEDSIRVGGIIIENVKFIIQVVVNIIKGKDLQWLRVISIYSHQEHGGHFLLPYPVPSNFNGLEMHL